MAVTGAVHPLTKSALADAHSNTLQLGRYFHIRLNNKRFAAKTPRFAGKRTVSAQVSVENTREKHGKR